MLIAQLCLTLWDPTDYSPPGSSVHRILQARILEWVAIPFSRGSSHPRDQTRVSHTADRFFAVWATKITIYSCRQQRRSIKWFLAIKDYVFPKNETDKKPTKYCLIYLSGNLKIWWPKTRFESLLLNQNWAHHSPACSKVNLSTLGCGEGKHSVYCKAPGKESRQLMF